MKNKLFSSSEVTHCQEEKAEKLAEIGAKLRQTRQEKSISLEKLAVKTMIRSHILEAIEEGKLDQLPEAIYTQRLIERYANAVDLDGKQLANFFTTTSKSEAKDGRAKVYLPVQKLKAHHLYVVYIFLVIFSIHILSKTSLISYSPEKQPSNSQIAATSGENEREGGANSGDQTRLLASSSNNLLENSPQQSPSNSVVNTFQNQDRDRPITVSVIVEEDSWVQVEIDGQIEFEGTLEPGTKKTWQAEEKLVFVAGNAGGVLVAFNNEQAKQVGKPGAVRELVWNVDNPGDRGTGEVQN